ncbi:hypothetical protein ACHQM5_005860 [Ranunculus cassubicifolius]
MRLKRTWKWKGFLLENHSPALHINVAYANMEKIRIFRNYSLPYAGVVLSRTTGNACLGTPFRCSVTSTFFSLSLTLCLSVLYTFHHKRSFRRYAESAHMIDTATICAVNYLSHFSVVVSFCAITVFVCAIILVTLGSNDK